MKKISLIMLTVFAVNAGGNGTEPIGLTEPSDEGDSRAEVKEMIPTPTVCDETCKGNLIKDCYGEGFDNDKCHNWYKNFSAGKMYYDFKDWISSAIKSNKNDTEDQINEKSALEGVDAKMTEYWRKEVCESDKNGNPYDYFMKSSLLQKCEKDVKNTKCDLEAGKMEKKDFLKLRDKWDAIGEQWFSVKRVNETAYENKINVLNDQIKNLNETCSAPKDINVNNSGWMPVLTGLGTWASTSSALSWVSAHPYLALETAAATVLAVPIVVKGVKSLYNYLYNYMYGEKVINEVSNNNYERTPKTEDPKPIKIENPKPTTVAPAAAKKNNTTVRNRQQQYTVEEIMQRLC